MSTRNKKKGILFLIFWLCSFQLFSQSQLEEYINLGLSNNLTLQEKQLDYKKSLLALNEARGLFFPNVAFQARYTVANGGRTIEFPLGDILNPVYSSLNMLTRNMPPAQQFPDIQVENEEFYFLRPTEHETKLSLTQPIFNPGIYYNYKINEENVSLKKIDEDIYKNHLSAEIKTAYFNYLKTEDLLDIIQNSKILAKENLATNQSLWRNDKVTSDAVMIAEAEIKKLEHKLAETMRQKKTAQAYFNFLLNRALEDSIISDSLFKQSLPGFNSSEIQDKALENRPEISAYNTAIKISELKHKAENSGFLPTLSAMVDYGFQGEKYRFTSDYDYTLASLVLRWEFFTGGQRKHAAQQALIEKEQVRLQKEKAVNQIRLEAISIAYEIDAAEKQLVALDEEIEALQQAFDIVNKKHKHGQANMLEYQNAKTSLENALRKKTITWYDYLIKYAQLERITATELNPGIP